MDEPLSNLDAKLRVQTRAEIARLHQRLKTTIVYVTHDQVEAMTMGTRIAVMNEGLLQQVGTPQVLYDTPINRFVAGFIGSPSMNFVEVTSTAPARPHGSSAPAWSIPLPAALSRAAADAVQRQDARRRLPAGAPRHRRGRLRRGARSGPGPTSSSTSATRSCSTSTPPTRTSWPIVGSEPSGQAGRHPRPAPAARQAPPVRRRDGPDRSRADIAERSAA